MEPHPPLEIPYATYRLHSPASVAWAAALGTPVAGGIVLALNYWKWGQKAAAAAAVGAGLFTTASIAWLAFISRSNVSPDMFVVVVGGSLVVAVLGVYLLASWLQGRRVASDLNAGAAKASGWGGAGIGLGFTTLSVGGFVAYIAISGINLGSLLDEFNTQGSVGMCCGQDVFYERGATREDAQRVGEALIAYGYFEALKGPNPFQEGKYRVRDYDANKLRAVMIAGPVGAREISFFVADGVWGNESEVLWYRELAEDITPAIGGKQVTMILLDQAGNEKKRLPIE